MNAWRLYCMCSHILWCRTDRAPIASPYTLDLPATEGSQPAALDATAALTLPLPLPPLPLPPLPPKAPLLPLLLPLLQPVPPLPSLCHLTAGIPLPLGRRLLAC